MLNLLLYLAARFCTEMDKESVVGTRFSYIFNSQTL
ncbi:hypothetical protein Cflav_PD6089 [Pedosphaera parvula Ellin514]|uniref:Uncharacterized protein n=1 Tax=Pedosphaera parvula (strain Ellin514) TaxID=320771 RepID=B9XAB3_PEDPL|nr:hypothetical protein Cflav_PD6089 [Pedosphaera parvula Ellin514]